MTRLKTIQRWPVVIGLAITPVLAQNYPPPQQNYPPAQQQNYPPPQQDYGRQQAPYYGQQPAYGPQAPNYPQDQLQTLVGRIALYPDPLLAQILSASTYSSVIPDAAGWARGHSNLTGDQLARAIREDGLPWDPSILALLPFPTVLDMMSGDMGWTQQLGNAVLANRGSVMDAVQQQRQIAQSYGYLRNSDQLRVVGGAGNIQILPTDPGLLYVPYYNPYVVYSRPRPGFFVGSAITFGPRIGISAFLPLGWGGARFGWTDHRIFVNNRPWERSWGNRETYVHPYENRAPFVEHREEHHDLHEYRGFEHRDDNRRDERHDDRRPR